MNSTMFRTSMRLGLALLLGAVPISSLRAADATPGTKGKEDLQLTLPPEFYAAPGADMAIYFDNIVCTQTPDAYKFVVTCRLGKTEERRWVVTPKSGQEGDYPLTVEVKDASGRKSLGKASTVLRVAAKKTGNRKSIRLLIIGDSLTAASAYPTEVARLLDEPANPDYEMLGTIKAAEKVRHEGYGGWRWETFASQYKPGPATAPNLSSSPFVFAGKGDKGELDVPRYVQEKCDGAPPDVITILLGVNDCFGAGKDPDDKKLVDDTIDGMFKNADVFLKALREAAPNAVVAVGLTTPPNSRESGFEANYKGAYHRWEWKRVQHELVQRELKHFGGREKESIFIIPTELNLDPVDGYPVDNGVHPNADGYKQIGASIYAWLKYRLQNMPEGKARGGATGPARRPARPGTH